MPQLPSDAISNELKKILYNSDGVTEFIQKHGNPYNEKEDSYQREPFAIDVRAGKNTPIYNAHSYHTKVPPEGIEPFIKNYTEEGDLILDPFCGSGMTGVASLKLNRRPILIDICPAATFIAYNYCTPVDVIKFEEEARRILDIIKEETAWLYETKCRKCGRKAVIEYTIWSDEFECPRCNAKFLLWDVAVTKDGEVKKHFECSTCKKELKKTECRKISAKPVKVNYTCSRCKRQECDVEDFDIEKLKEIERRWKRIYEEKKPPDMKDGFWPMGKEGKHLWFPEYPFMFIGERWGDTWRAGVHSGITNVHHFYTKTNLWALARLWEEINKVNNERVKKALQFSFTSMLFYCSKLRRFRAGKKGGGPLSGTLYISSLITPLNPSKSFTRNALKFALEAFKSIKFTTSTNSSYISTQSATDLSNISSNSIDYIFTDPPFGQNLMYSELNFLWEAWIGLFTDNKDEAIINDTQRKNLTEYKDLMSKSFKESYRVLKPGRWMTVVFHNSRGDVWQAIQDGLKDAGFMIAMIGTFDKKQKSFQQVTSTGAVGYDVVVNCYKPKATVKNGITGKTTNEAIVGFIADKLNEIPLEHSDERTERMLHSKTIGFFMQKGVSLEKLSFDEFKKILNDKFKEIDGYWYLPYQRPRIKGQKKHFGYISTEIEAIEWLDTILKVCSKTYGEIAPNYFVALGSEKLKKDLKQILDDNFIEERGRWRNPTASEKKRLMKLATSKTAHEIRFYLDGILERDPKDIELCEWVKFCYDNELFEEASKVFDRVAEDEVEYDIYKNVKKVAEICRMKVQEK